MAQQSSANSGMADCLLGEILVSTAGVAPAQIEEALAIQRSGTKLRLGVILVHAKVVAKADVLRALALQVEQRYVAPVTRGEFARLQATQPRRPRHFFRTRLLSLVSLAAVAILLVRGAWAVHLALTDSFVAPLILSPGSDLVLQAKLSLNRLVSERQRLVARLQADKEAVSAADRAIALLTALNWGPAEEDPLAGAQDTVEQGELRALLTRQGKYVDELKKDRSAGLVREGELVRERNTLNHIRVALFQNQRERLSSQIDLARLDVDLLKIQSERRTREAGRLATEEELGHLDELLAEIKERPVFRSVEGRQDLAFVPYSQLPGVATGAGVHWCKLWGMFGCQRVGSVLEVLAGEVVAQDPSGATARGQYILLELNDPVAAQARVLRVRSKEDSPVEAPTALGSAH